MMNGNESVVGKRKSRLSPEHDQPPNKKYDSPRSFSGDEAYYSFSYQSCRGDETDGSSCEDVLDIDEEEPQEISTESLQGFYQYLVAQMEPLEVIDHLHDSELFSENFLEECKETPSRRRRNDLLIKEIYNISLIRSSAVLQLFATALKETGQHFIVNHLKKQPSVVKGKDRYKRSSLNAFFYHMKERLIDSIEPRKFIDDLLVNKTISFNDHEDITRLELRKRRVDFIMEIVEQNNSNSMEVIKAIIIAYPKLFEDFKHETRNNYFDDIATDQSKGRTAVSIRLHLKCGPGQHGRRDQLRKIEKTAVERFPRSTTESNEMIDELVEECRCIFEGLKISSVVIQLLTRAGDSLHKILKKIQSGKAIDWLLSILNEDDKRMLSEIGVTTLQVSVSVAEDGNLSSLIPVQDCICLLDKQTIFRNKETLAGGLTDTESLIQQMQSFGIPICQWIKTQLVQNKSKINTALLDFFASEDTRHVCFCLLEEHIKSRDPSYFESLFTRNNNEDIEISTSDIKRYEEFLEEELEVQVYLPIIRSWENEKSNRLLKKLSRCSCRRSRVAVFMRFLLRQKDLTWFWAQVRQKQKYIWETITSIQRTTLQLKTDDIALKVMNDKVVDEIDPFRLRQYMKQTTIFALAFDEFETIQSRKAQAQYMLNRITVDTIDDFMVALRRCGYEHIYRQIRAGPLAKSYVCPRIHSANSRTKFVYKDQFDISSRLSIYENSDKCKEAVGLEPPPFNYSISCHLTPPGSGDFAMSPKSGFRSPASVGSAKDSESGIFSGSEDPACEIANTHDFDDEGISSCSPGASLEIDHVGESKSETQTRRIRRKPLKGLLRLIDSVRPASRDLLRSRSKSESTFYNCLHAEAMEENTSDDFCETLQSQSNTETEEKDYKCQRRTRLRRTHSEVVKVPNKLDNVITTQNAIKQLLRRLRYPNDDEEISTEDNVVPSSEIVDEIFVSFPERKFQNKKYNLRDLPHAWSDTSDTKASMYTNQRRNKLRRRHSEVVKVPHKLDNVTKQTAIEQMSRLRYPKNDEDASECNTPTLKARKSNYVYQRSLSDSLDSGKHLKNIPHFVKSCSEEKLAEYFDSRCSMKTVHEERSVSSPPNDRERCIFNEEQRSKRLLLTAKSYRKPSTSEQSNDTD